MRRCKHLCCREGLEKPPKLTRKQSTNGNQVKSGLNQLTLSASIPRTKAGRTSTIEARDKGSGKTHTKDVESTGINSDITDTGDIFHLSFTSHVSKSQCSSSDYGDDSFDDLPSPSKLLVGFTTGTTQVNEKTRANVNQCDDIAEADDTWTDVTICSRIQFDLLPLTRQNKSKSTLAHQPTESKIRHQCHRITPYLNEV